MVAGLIKSLETRYEEYLGDESKMKGTANSISFPETTEDVIAIVKHMISSSIPITVQGGKTGICGGAVPLEGHILNLSHMTKVLGLHKTDTGYLLKVQPGLMLSELEKTLYKKSFDTSAWNEASLSALKTFKMDKAYFWPPAPTETSATIGGILATNAQGICGYLYGDTKQYVEEICLIDAHGKEITLRRGEYKVQNHQCILPSGETLVVNTDILKLPQEVDLIDFYLGSEGMYGIIVSATLKLIKRPQEVWGIGFFFEVQDNLFTFAEEVRLAFYKEGTAAIAAIEYIDKLTLDNIQELKKVATKLNELPDVDEKYIGMIYIELHGEYEGDIENIAEKLMELAIEYGSAEEATWALSGEAEIEKMRAFRHAAPESINITLEKAKQSDERIMKLSTDLTIPEKTFGEIVTKYQKDAKDNGIEISIFGHVAGNHVHVNILPKNYGQYVVGKKLIEKWGIDTSKDGGIVFSEHGIGKIKKELFQCATAEDVLRNIRNIKKTLDPKGILNPGNTFDE